MADPEYEEKFDSLCEPVGLPLAKDGDAGLHAEIRLRCLKLAMDRQTSFVGTYPDALVFARRMARFVIEGDTPNPRRRQPAEENGAAEG